MADQSRWHVPVERLRFRIADAVDKLPGQCWADLVSWALGHNRRAGNSIWPWRPVTSLCRQISPPNDRCYCGKICVRRQDEVAS
jgi:hypothetical protein